jgi:hypothetical protein
MMTCTRKKIDHNDMWKNACEKSIKSSVKKITKLNFQIIKY